MHIVKCQLLNMAFVRFFAAKENLEGTGALACMVPEIDHLPVVLWYAL